MGVVEMHPGEPRCLGCADPSLCRSDHGVGATLELGEAQDAALLAVVVVVDVEPAVQPESGIENESADESAALITRAMKRRREGGNGSVQPKRAVIVDSVPGRIERGEYGAVRGKSERNVGKDPLEANPLARKPIQMGSESRLRAIASEPVEPERVQGYEEQVSARERPGSERLVRPKDREP